MTAQPTTPEQTTSPLTDASSLRGLCGGAVHLPGDSGYDAARMPWNVAVQQHPAAVAYPASAEEVVEVVRAATAAGLRVAAQGTGHNAGPLGALGDAVLVRTSAMRDVEVDAEARTARVGAGALWIDVVDAVAPYGLAALHGSSPDVGVVGYSLGGGMGWYARELGLATNNITAVEIVTAEGTLVRATAETEPDLFWAVRGGGGNFGVVTALELRLFPIDTVYAGMLVWDRSEAEKVLRAWARWTATAPDSVTTSFRILQLPPFEEIPAPIRGRQIVVIDGAVNDEDCMAEKILAELRALEPEMDTFARVPSASIVRLHMDPEGPTPGVTQHQRPRPACPPTRSTRSSARSGTARSSRCSSPSCASSAGRSAGRPRVPARCRWSPGSSSSSGSRSRRRRRWLPPGRPTPTRWSR